jgi:hypothetical protein
MNKGGKGEGQGRRGGELVNNGEVRDIMKELGRTALLEVKHYKNSMRSTLNVGTFFDRTQNSPRSPRGFLKCV